MLKRIKLHNFESHKDSELEFNKGINIIIGENSKGKSAIIDGIRLICENKSDSNNFISYWTKKNDSSKVEIETIEEDIIERERSNLINKYKLNGDNFESFKTNVPTDIQKALNISSINTQYQMTPYFLLSSTSGQISKYLNEIVNLEEIDNSFAFLDKRKREYSNIIFNKNNDLSNLNKKLEDYKNIDYIESIISNLESLEKKVNKLNKVRGEANILNIQLKELNKKLEDYRYIIKCENVLKDTRDLLTHKSILEKKYKDILDIYESLSYNKKQLNKYNEIIKYENKISSLLNILEKKKEIEVKKKSVNIIYKSLLSLNKTNRKYNEIITYEKITDQLFKLTNIYNKLLNLRNDINNNLNNLKNKKKELKNNQIVIDDNTKLFKKLMPDECPLCGSSTKNINVMFGRPII